MAKLNREALAHYIDVKMTKDASKVSELEGGAEWEIVGDDIEEMSVELNPDTEQRKNILGQTKTIDNGYEPSMEADPFYADPEKKLYPILRDIALGRRKGDEKKTLMLEVIVEDAEAAKHLAYVQEVSVTVNSYGGNTEGVNFPFTVSENGKRVKGYVTKESLPTGNPKFTAGEITD